MQSLVVGKKTHKQHVFFERKLVDIGTQFEASSKKVLGPHGCEYSVRKLSSQ
jgi:hypothetical protein